MTDRIPPPAPGLPDDPREVFRLIIEALRPLDGGPTETMPGDFARICHTVLAGAKQTGGELDPLLDPLMNLAVQAEDAADLYRDVVHKVWDMARHGTGDHREWDRHRAEFLAPREGKQTGLEGAA